MFDLNAIVYELLRPYLVSGAWLFASLLPVAVSVILFVLARRWWGQGDKGVLAGAFAFMFLALSIIIYVSHTRSIVLWQGAVALFWVSVVVLGLVAAVFNAAIGPTRHRRRYKR